MSRSAGTPLAVGAIGEESNATGINGNQGDNSASPHAGAVYVFTRTSGVWSQQAYVKASNTEANDVFGKTVALNSDTLAVGALQEGSALTGVTGGSRMKSRRVMEQRTAARSMCLPGRVGAGVSRPM
ncbi:MAG: FG-GAP repeat protein [Nitrospira sp.]